MEYLTKQHWMTICQNVTNVATPILKYDFNTRLRSEIISSLFEMQAQEYYESIGLKVKSASNDHEPDLFFEEQQCPVEIKVTKEKKQVNSYYDLDECLLFGKKSQQVIGQILGKI